jgi:hypothetical protein
LSLPKKCFLSNFFAFLVNNLNTSSLTFCCEPNYKMKMGYLLKKCWLNSPGQTEHKRLSPSSISCFWINKTMSMSLVAAIIFVTRYIGGTNNRRIEINLH